MKKLLLGILLMFIPCYILAETTSYEKIDIKINIEIGTKVENIGYKIFASTNDNEILKDRTEEFTGELSIFKVNEDDSKEILPKDYIINSNETYGFYLSNIKPNNNATLNINDISKVLINTAEQDNDHLKISISENVLKIEYAMNKVKPEEEPKEEKEEIVEEENKCLLGLSLCCKEFKGISYCYICIGAVVLLIILVSIINVIVDKREDRKYKDF